MAITPPYTQTAIVVRQVGVGSVWLTTGGSHLNFWGCNGFDIIDHILPCVPWLVGWPRKKPTKDQEPRLLTTLSKAVSAHRLARLLWPPKASRFSTPGHRVGKKQTGGRPAKSSSGYKLRQAGGGDFRVALGHPTGSNTNGVMHVDGRLMEVVDGGSTPPSSTILVS